MSEPAPPADQPPPVPSDRPAVWSLVIADMHTRDAVGRERCGVRLQPFNGRDFLVDAYQECLDQAVYLRGAIYERDELLAEIGRLKADNLALAERCHGQAELLSKRAER